MSAPSRTVPASPLAAGEQPRPWALKSLPPFPAVAMQLISLLQDEDVPMRQIVNLLRVDPALSTELLRVSNSALYGVSRQIDNVSHAVVVLGTDTVRRIALTVSLGKFAKNCSKTEALKRCWDHSLACALTAERLAELLHQSKDRAYTAGLLHDIGRLALLACYPREFDNMLHVAQENDFDELECERELFDIDHCAAGEWLALHWNLPDDMVEAIARHRDLKPSDASLPSIVAAADRIADALGFPVLPNAAPQPIEHTLAPLPLSDHEAARQRFEGFDEEIRAAAAAISPG